MMKRLFAFLILAVLMFSCLQDSLAEALPIIRDDADLISEADEKEIEEAMTPIGEYCTPIFWTTDMSGDVNTKARAFMKALLGEKNGVMFMIDMKERKVCVYSLGETFQQITTDKAEEICEHVYRFATDGDYKSCAVKAFMEIQEILKTEPGEEETKAALGETYESGAISATMVAYRVEKINEAYLYARILLTD